MKFAPAQPFWSGSSNDNIGQIVLSHEDIVEAARNPRVVLRRVWGHPSTFAILCGVAYVLWQDRQARKLSL